MNGKNTSEAQKGAPFWPKASTLPIPDEVRIGHECSSQARQDPGQLAEQLLSFDVVSFDIFDTLILRPFINPYDMFYLLSSRYKESNFYAIRRLAEQEARERKKQSINSPDVTIYEIYHEMKNYIQLDEMQSAEWEIEMEMDTCYANPYVKAIYDCVRERGKTVIAVSDMHIPKEQMAELLRRCGYPHFSDIFISCDYRASKQDGRLFEIVKEAIGPRKSYIHIGDNSRADHAGAIRAGWQSCHLPSVHFLGGPYRPPIIGSKRSGLSPLIGSACNAITNGRFHNGLARESEYYEFGYKCGGPFVIGFCTWIHDLCVERGMEKVLFTSRDGYTLKRVYDRLYGDPPSEYALWSRSIAARVSAIHFPHYFKNLLLYERRYHYFKSTVMEELQYFKVPDLASQLEEYGLTPKTRIGTKYPKQYETFIEFVTDHMQQVREALRPEDEAVCSYYQKLLGSCRRVACVDIGWSGMNLNALKVAVESEWKPDCQVIGLLAGMLPQSAAINPVQLAEKDQEVYLFSPTVNTGKMGFLMGKENAYPYFFEILSGAAHSSVYRIEKNYDGKFVFTFNVPEVENYWVANELRQGMLDFAETYRERFKAYPVMLRIPGSDSASIFINELKKYSRLSESFGDLTYQFSRLMPSFDRYVRKVKNFL